MEVMVLGFARRLRQASQAASTMASWLSKTRFESQFWRRYCQMFSTGLSSGAREGRKTRVMFFGTTRRELVCQPARSSRSTAWAPRRTDGAEQAGAFVPLIGGLAWARAAPRPLPYEAVLLADTGLVLEPDLDRLAFRQTGAMSVQRRGEIFLKAATVSSSWAGWRGRALRCEKPSCFRILPIVRSW